jgi:WD40 repeat protein
MKTSCFHSLVILGLILAGCVTPTSETPHPLGLITSTAVPSAAVTSIAQEVTATVSPTDPTETLIPIPPVATPIARENTPIPVPDEPLTPQNANRVVELARLGKGNANMIRYSPDGSTLVLVSSLGIYFYDNQQKLVDFIETDQPVESFTYAPDGSVFAVGSSHTINFYKNHRQWIDVLHADTPLDAISFSPDGNTLITRSVEGALQFWSWKDKQLQKTVKTNIQAIPHGIFFSPGRNLVTFTQQDPETYEIYLSVLKVSDGSILFQKSLSYAYGYQYSNDGESLYIADGSITKYRLTDGSIQETWTLQGNEEIHLNSVIVSDDEKQMIVSSTTDYKTIYLWKLQDATPYQSIKFENDTYLAPIFQPAKTCHFGADGGPEIPAMYSLLPDKQRILVSSSNGSLQIRRLSNGVLLRSTPQKNKLAQTNILVDGFIFNSRQKSIAVHYNTGLVEIYDQETLQLQGRISGHVAEYNSVVISPILSANRTYLAAGASDDTLRIWNIPAGSRASDIRVEANALAFSPDGQNLAIGTRDWLVKILSLKDGKLQNSQAESLGWIDSLSFAPDGKTLVSGSDDCTLRTWQVEKGIVLKNTVEEDTSKDALWGQIKHISMSPDGLWVIGTGENGIIRYNTKTQDIQTFENIHGLDVSAAPDNHSFASISGVGLAIRDIATLNKIRENKEIQGSHLTYSPDGSLLAVGTREGVIMLVGAQNLNVIGELNGHRNEITRLSFSPDGKLLASASKDGTIRLWGILSR